MATQNFVVHNGLTVGALTIDATTSNVSLPVTKQLAIGNVILRDNGDGKLHIRNITDNADAELIGTVGAVSTTSGNIQIGTNHIESTNPNGPISLRPDGSGNIAFSSNTIMIGHGGAYTLVGTGIQTDPVYGINYPATNIIVTMSAINSSGNLRLSMTTPATSPTTGALQVMGGLGVVGASYIGGNLTINGNLFVNGNLTYINANNLNISDSIIYLADDNTADVIDIGFVSSFTSPARYQHTGFVRDATDGVWKLFANVVAEPTTTVDFTNANYSSLYVGNIQTVNSANIGSTLNVVGNVLAKTGTLNGLTVNGEIDSQHIVPLASNTYSVGSSTLWYSSFWGAAVNAQYADLAEKYLADSQYEPGTVLMFGGEYEVTLAEEGTRRVAGVVSTNPAYLMNHQIAGDNIVDLALTGRVPVKVTGYIQKGDMMVSAGNGRARASAMPQIGTVIGKALQDFDGSEGVIEVVVGRL